MSRRRVTFALLAALVLGAGLLIGAGYRNATAAPILRRLTLTVPGYPSRAPPLRVVLFSDVHVHGPDMPPTRFAKLVGQINSLDPDVIVSAGDFVGNTWIGREYPVEEAIAPMRGLKARFGVFAVLGNNDYRAGASEVTHALERAGVHVLVDQAVSAGPIRIGGIDGRIHRTGADWNASRTATYDALNSAGGVQVLVAHRPDEFVPAPQSINLILAGHTHCGQIVLPWFGALETGSDYGPKYACGIFRDRSKVLVVTAGLGTSYVPLRFGAHPDVWLISIGGPEARRTNTN